MRVTTLDVIGQILYDSNVSGGNSDLAAAKGLKPADEIFAPSVNLNIVRPVGREVVFLQASAGYDFYRVNSILNRERIDLRGGVSGRVAACNATVTGDYDRFQSNLGDLSRLAVKNTVDHESIGLDGSCGRPIGLAPTFSVNQNWTANSSLQQSFSNSNSTTASGGLAYRRPTFGSLSVFGQYTTTTYPNRGNLIGFPGISSGYTSWAGGLRFERRLGARIQADATLSYTSLSPDIAGTGGFKGLTYSGDITYRASRRLSGNLDFQRGPVPSNRLNSLYSLNQSLGAAVSYEAGPRVTLRLGASYVTEGYGGGLPSHFLELT
ncbi:MAG: hypothetical protein ABI242_08600, partial [Caulobacteraceae bacterium]